MADEDAHSKLEEEWNFKRRRTKDHIANCKNGYYGHNLPGFPRVLEIHHILCVHACSDATMPAAQKDFIRACLANTTWDIDSDHNTIGLPLKWAYVADSDNLTNWGLLPCHQVEHGAYLEEVNSWVTKNVWKKISGAKAKEQCEYIKGKNVAELFNAGSVKWKKFLNARGKKFGGTKASLDYCLDDVVTHGLDDTNWHVPFSMNPSESDIAERNKPKRTNGQLLREALLSMVT